MVSLSQAFKAAHSTHASSCWCLLAFTKSPWALCFLHGRFEVVWQHGQHGIAELSAEREREREWTCSNGGRCTSRHENREWMSSNQWNWSHLSLTSDQRFFSMYFRGSVILHPRCLRTSALDGQAWPWPGSQPRFRLHEPGADEEQLLQGLPSMLEAGWADCSIAYVKEKCIKMLKYFTFFCVSILHTEVSHPFAP